MQTSAKSSPAAAPDLKNKCVAIVTAQFYPELAAQLRDGARRAAHEAGLRDEDIIEAEVPGCFELPLAIKRLLTQDDRIACAAALGIIIRGATPHFDFVATECARGIMQVSLATNVPVGFGVLTTENQEQAAERADPARGDKGFEALNAAFAVLAINDRKPQQPIGFRP